MVACLDVPSGHLPLLQQCACSLVVQRDVQISSAARFEGGRLVEGSGEEAHVEAALGWVLLAKVAVDDAAPSAEACTPSTIRSHTSRGSGGGDFSKQW